MQFTGVRMGCKGLTRNKWFALLFGSLLMTGSGRADDLSECMIDKLQQADDKMTIGELRLLCQKQLHDSTFIVDDRQDEAVSERLRQDEKHVLQPFTLMAHKQNYILLAAYNASGYNSEVYQQEYNDPTIELDDTEAQFQISIKAPLAIDLFNMVDIYGAYTNRSFWQVYNSDISAPFRETNHEPELWMQFRPNWEFLGFTNTVNVIGIVHQSNGRGGLLSRSWNRVYASFIAERGNLGLSFKPWYRLPEDDDDDDNPDITDYMGHYELRAVYKWDKHTFSGMSRNNLESGFSKGTVQLGWSFPLGDYPYLRGYVQYFNGYGESLIDYDQHANRIGLGVALTDLL